MDQNLDPEVAEKFSRLIKSAAAGPLSRSEVNTVLAALAEHLGLSGLALDEDGLAQLTIDGTVDLMIYHLPHLPGVIIAVPLDQVASDDPAALKVMLQANMSWPLTRGGIFSILPNTGQTVLCWHLIIADRDVERIDRDLAEMVAYAKTWLEGFTARPEDVADQDGDDATVPSFIIRP